MLCFCRECPCNCGAREGQSICQPCLEGDHCQSGMHSDDFEAMDRAHWQIGEHVTIHPSARINVTDGPMRAKWVET